MNITCPKCRSTEIVWDKKGFDAHRSLDRGLFYGILAGIAGGVVSCAFLPFDGLLYVWVPGFFLGGIVGFIVGVIVGGFGDSSDPVRFCRHCGHRWEPTR